MPEKAKTFEERPHKGPQWKEPQSHLDSLLERLLSSEVPTCCACREIKEIRTSCSASFLLAFGTPRNEVVLETRPRSKVEPEGRKTRKSIAVARTSQVDETILDQSGHPETSLPSLLFKVGPHAVPMQCPCSVRVRIECLSDFHRLKHRRHGGGPEAL